MRTADEAPPPAADRAQGPGRSLSLRPSSRLGPYEIVDLLGVGGMGEVYRARDPRLGREVAIKVLPAEAQRDELAVERFVQEARAASALEHPNIVAVHDVGRHQDGTPYLVTELLEGTTLRERLAGRPLPRRKAIEYAAAVAHGLAAAHGKGIVHRDVKPENLFITVDGRVKLLDFGVAKLQHREGGVDGLESTASGCTAPGAIIGTVGYMAPEQVRGQAADARSDLFALGAVLYEMIAGRRAFTGDSPIDVATAILGQEPPSLEGVDAALERLVLRCLEKDPAERFQSARDVAFFLDGLVSTSASRVVAPPRRRRRVWLAPTLVAVALALAAGLFVAGRASAPTPVPRYTRLTFRHGAVRSARFSPDGASVIFSANWDRSPMDTLVTRPGAPEWRSLGLPEGGQLLALSKQGEMALLVGQPKGEAWWRLGTLARVPLAGGAPKEVLSQVQHADYGPDGHLAVVRRDDEGRFRLEYPPGKLLFRSLGRIAHPRVSPQGDRVAFFDHPFVYDDRGSLAVVDRDGEKTILSSGWESEQGLAWSPDGTEVWFTAAEAGVARGLYAVDRQGRQRPLLRAPGGLTLFDVDSRGRLLLSLEKDTRQMFYHGPSSATDRDLSWFDYSHPADLSADGKTVLFTELSEGVGGDYAVYLRGTDGSAAVRLGTGLGLALSPDGQWALSVRPVPGAPLVLLPTGVGEAVTLPRGNIEEYQHAAFGADGKRIFFGAREPGHAARVYTQELPAGAPKALTPEGISDLGPTSPDGRQIGVFLRDKLFRLYPTNGGEPVTLTALEKGKDFPARFSEDGRALWLIHFDEAAAEGARRPLLQRFDLATGERATIRAFEALDPVTSLAVFRVTPDGQHYVYYRSRMASDLFLVDRAG